MKQTAVQWMQKELHKFINGESTMTGSRILEQALQMEKEQIKDAFDEGQNWEFYNRPKAETYYNETYGGKP